MIFKYILFVIAYNDRLNIVILVYNYFKDFIILLAYLGLLFVLNNFMDRKFPSKFRPSIVDGSSVNSDKLYKNMGNETFADVSEEAGILIEGYSHGISIRDLNLDGWPDVLR